MRLIDADKLSQKIESIYLGSDTKENHRGCAETEDTMIGKFQVIDTIFEMPTVDVNGLIIAEFENAKAEIRYKGLYNEQIEEIIDNRISELKGEKE